MLNQTSPPDPNALFGAIDFSGRENVIVAVSGGGDSLSLLLLLSAYLQDRNTRIQAVTVDHGLRPESADEAQRVEELCADFGIPHRVMRWTSKKPGTGVSEAAREARFALLAQAAHEGDTDIVLTGHTADDQAETLAMRKERGSGRGLAGIADATLFSRQVWFLRPLLQTRRAALRTYLRNLGIAWIEDPTNRDPRYERVRIRQRLDDEAVRSLAVEANEAARQRKDAGGQTGLFICRCVEKPAPGLFRLRPGCLRNSEPEIALYAFRIMLAVAGGSAHLPAASRASDILAQMERSGARATLSRAVISLRDGQYFIHRENRNLPKVPLGDGVVWDNRYRIQRNGGPEDLTIGPLGVRLARALDLDGYDAPDSLVRGALATQPAAWAGEMCLGPAWRVPELRLQPLAACWEKLLPDFDLAPAGAVMHLLNGAPVPKSPFFRGKKA